MANTAQAEKRARQDQVRRLHNMSRKSRLSTFCKKCLASIAQKDGESAREHFKTVQQLADRYATKGLIHKNRAARIKSRLNARIKAL